jgi:AcrR family transcriptional regulator
VDIKKKIKAAAKQVKQAAPSRKVSVSDVARAAGLSRQTVYRHIGGKGKVGKLAGNRMPAEGGDEKSKDRILTAAYRTISKVGYAAATVDKIAAEAGLTKGSVYWHFATKKELFLTLLEKRLAHRLIEHPKYAHAAVQNADMVPGLTVMLSNQLSFALSDPDWQKIYLSYLLHGQDKDIAKRLHELYTVLINSGTGILSKMQKDGLLDLAIDTRALTIIWAAVLDGLVLASLRSPSAIDYKALAPQLARVFWEGIKRRD